MIDRKQILFAEAKFAFGLGVYYLYEKIKIFRVNYAKTKNYVL